MGTYQMSCGGRVEKSVIDYRVRQAKIAKLEAFILDHDYYFCEEIGCRTPNQGPFDCSHNISVNECQKMGQSELAWDVSNITLRCRKCHNIHDKTY